MANRWSHHAGKRQLLRPQRVWLEEGALLRDAGRLAGIPGVLLHGHLDLNTPLGTTWELTRTWPDAKLLALPDPGHQSSDTKRDRMLSALDKFARE
jgi:proline iminopeptidase